MKYIHDDDTVLVIGIRDWDKVSIRGCKEAESQGLASYWRRYILCSQQPAMQCHSLLHSDKEGTTPPSKRNTTQFSGLASFTSSYEG